MDVYWKIQKWDGPQYDVKGDIPNAMFRHGHYLNIYDRDRKAGPFSANEHKLLFNAHIFKYVNCCGIREFGKFYFSAEAWTAEYADAVIKTIKDALHAHATVRFDKEGTYESPYSLAHLTLTRANTEEYKKQGYGPEHWEKLMQPAWFVRMLEEWEGATKAPWILNRNSSKDLQMWVLPV